MAEPRLPLAELPEAELERALRDLGRQLDYPPAPDLAGRVRDRLEADGAARPKPVAFRAQAPLWLAAALLLLLGGTLAFVPEARQAVADRLGLRGVLINWEEEPAPAASPVGARLLLGRAVTLREAQEEVTFGIVMPTATGFADPAEVYLQGEGEEAMVSFVYPAGPRLPESDMAGVGALLTQFRGELERPLIEKGLRHDGGEAGAGTRLEAVSVNGQPGFWLEGAPHSFFLVCAEREQCREERYRLAGNVLLWERGELTLRLESALSRDEALAIAATVQTPQ